MRRSKSGFRRVWYYLNQPSGNLIAKASKCRDFKMLFGGIFSTFEYHFLWQITRTYMTVCCWINLKSWFWRTHTPSRIYQYIGYLWSKQGLVCLFRRILNLLKIQNTCPYDSGLLLQILWAEVCVFLG